MGIESIRRQELVEAAIAEIGAAGSANVTVGQIAKRAGVSPALAFHYFGGKEQLFLGAMRHILRIYGAEVRRHLTAAQGPRARLDAIVAASFAPSNFVPHVVSAWLVFYVTAQRSAEAARLLRVYRGRLHSNLLHELKALGVAEPAEKAEAIGAMIDGLYIRQGTEATDASRMVQDLIARLLEG